jgi:hypothetical protein
MAKARRTAWLLAGCLLSWASAATAWADNTPTVSQMLNTYHPTQQSIVMSTPSAQEQEKCTVEPVLNARNAKAGWLLRDPQGRPVRRYYDANGDGKIDVWSYYLDGVEVYRERSTQFNKVVDECRWLNSGGMKWGVSSKGDGKIDFWRMISAEEVSQEVLQAVVTKDFDRLKALWITDADIDALEMSPAEATRIRELRNQAQAKFQATVAKLALTPQAHWERLEATAPQCLPGDQTGMKRDLIKYQRSAILYEQDGKHDWLQTGEMVQVGLAWRLVDAPAPGLAEGTADSGPLAGNDPAVQPLLDELGKLDKEPPKDLENKPVVVRYNLKRADVLQKIVAKTSKPEDKDQWVRQVADCLSAAAQSSPATDKTAYERLADLAQQLSKSQPASPLAAYVVYREISADYYSKIGTGAGAPGNFAKLQEAYLARLTKFVQDYPSGEDIPDALFQLATGSEAIDKEIEAKKWYKQLVTNHADKKPWAEKAAGALRRLELEGKPLELAGPTLDGKAFNVKTLVGKVVVVYYWASGNDQVVGDLARLKSLLANYAAKGVELVCVNLDSAPAEASKAIERAGVPAIHLYQAGGLESPLASYYGIVALPNLYLVGKDGKVVSRTVQVGTLEEEIKKLIK